MAGGHHTAGHRWRYLGLGANWAALRSSRRKPAVHPVNNPLTQFWQVLDLLRAIKRGLRCGSLLVQRE